MNLACIIGAGYSFVGGLPLTNYLFNVDIDVVSNSQRKRIERVWRDYDSWRAANPDKNVEQYLQAVYVNHFGSYFNPPFRDAVELIALALATARDESTGYRDPRYDNSRVIYPSKNYIHQSFWKTIVTSSAKVGIVTTNYDLLIERSLRHRPMTRGFGTGFYYGGLNRRQLLIGRAIPFSREYPQKVVELEGDIPVFKLHGSLNWSLDNGAIKLYQDLRAVFRHGNQAAIVPPLTEKETPDWLKPVWLAAKRVLSEAETWIVCGYSLPDYDIAVNDLLRTAAKSSLKRIYLLDPLSNQLLAKYTSIAPDVNIVCLSELPLGIEELARLLQKS